MTEKKQIESIDKYLYEVLELLKQLSKLSCEIDNADLSKKVSDISHYLGNKFHGLNLLWRAGELGILEKNNLNMG